MKKFFNLAMMLVFALITPFVLFACSANLESIKIEAGSIKTTYVKGETVNLNGVKVIAYYSDDTSKEINIEDVDFSTIDTSVIGEQTLTVTYQEKSCTVTITVYNSIEDSYTITGFEAPQFVQDFKANIKDKGDTAAQNETEFFVNESVQNNNIIYLVGDDNAFKFLPEITALDENRTPMTLNAYKSVSKVFVKEEGNYTELTDNLATYVAVNNETSTFDFTDAAVGKEFKIEVRPFYIENAVDPDFNVTFEFKVIDGFNVHNEYELSIIDNVNEGYAEMKAQYGTNVNTSAAILHKNMELKPEHTSPNLYYKSTDEEVKQNPTLEGSLKDFNTLYERHLSNDEDVYETFAIESNFFTIDTQAIPLVKAFSGSLAVNAITHSNLFVFKGTDVQKSVIELNNLNVIGNANKEENTENAGGLILVKSDGNCLVKANNCLVRTIAIAWFCSDESAFELDHVKTYDCYSNMVYLYRKSSFVVKNCELKRCGGPIVICDQEKAEEVPEKYSNVFVDENSVIESYVTGQESWFTQFGEGEGSVSSYVAMLTTLDPIFTTYSQGTKTLLKDNKFNVNYVLYDQVAMTAPDQKTRGYSEIKYVGLDETTKSHILDMRGMVSVGQAGITVEGAELIADETERNRYIETAIYRYFVGPSTIIFQSNNVTFALNQTGIPEQPYALAVLDMSSQSLVNLDVTGTGAVADAHRALLQQFMQGEKLSIILNGTLGIVLDFNTIIPSAS